MAGRGATKKKGRPMRVTSGKVPRAGNAGGGISGGAMSASRAVGHVSCLSPYSQQYAHQLANPFADFSTIVGVPDHDAYPSRKVRIWSRGTASAPAGGTGFVVVLPHNMVDNNGNAPIWYTSTAYAGSTFDASAGTGKSNAFSNAPYTSSATTTRARLVACAVRIRYNGTELDRGGHWVGRRAEPGADLDGDSEADLNKHPHTKQQPVPDNTARQADFRVYWVPQQAADAEYYAIGTYHPDRQKVALGLMLKPPGADMSIVWEVAAIVEYIGPDTRGLTHNASDPVGMAAVRTASQTQPAASMVGSGSANALKSGASEVVAATSSGIGRGLAQYAHEAGRAAGRHLGAAALSGALRAVTRSRTHPQVAWHDPTDL